MKKRQRLGQHFLISQNIAKSIVDSANISNDEIVLEIGTGEGILTPLLCSKAKKVISIEADKSLFENAKLRFSSLENLELVYGDGFSTKKKFDVFVSNLPYSQSRKAIEWLIQQQFSRAIVMVQKEFAKKLTSNREKRAITILANHGLEIEPIMDVSKRNFRPEPKVDSIVLRLTKKATIHQNMINTINKLFSYKRKTLKNILKEFDLDNSSSKRLEELSGDEIIQIANQIKK